MNYQAKNYSAKDIISELAALNLAPYGTSSYTNGAWTVAAYLLYPNEDSLRDAIDLVADDVESYLNDQAERRADEEAKGM